MSVIFNQNPDRQTSFAFKWEKYKGRDIIPAWVADTEFRCAQPILDAIQERVEHGVLGYTLPAQYEPANLAVQRWLAQQHDWQIELDWIVWTPGVVPAFNVACKAYANAGGNVLIQSPNYPPLLAAPGNHGLHRVDVNTVIVDERWTLDFEQLEIAAADPRCSLFILCNPMNPVGSMLTDDELDRIADICERHNIVLCSDEIHCDLILQEGVKHIPAGRKAALKDRSITLMAASKTFNVAGLGASFAIIPDPALRLRFNQAASGMMPWANILGLVATEAAFEHGGEWLKQQLVFLRENRDILCNAVNATSGLSTLKADATFLAWIDASGLGVADTQAWAEAKGVGPSPGRDFGAPEFFRVNFGCSRDMLNEIISRLCG